MLSIVKMEKNKQKFLATNEEYGIFTPQLQEFLGDAFFISPASIKADFYGCYPGGLINHLIKVCKYSLLLNESLPLKIRQDKRKLIRTAFLCQIGKTFMFEENPVEWSRNNGQYYIYSNSESVRMRVGERSVFYCNKYGVSLEEDQFQAILSYDKPEDPMVKWYGSIPSQLLKQSVELAILEETHGE